MAELNWIIGTKRYIQLKKAQGSGFELSAVDLEDMAVYESRTKLIPSAKEPIEHTGLIADCPVCCPQHARQEIEQQATIGVAPYDHEAYKANLEMLESTNQDWLCKAQARNIIDKIFEELEKPCPHGASYGPGTITPKRVCDRCFKKLKKKSEIK